MEKNKYPGIRIVDTVNDVVLVIKETFTVRVTPAFNWKGERVLPQAEDIKPLHVQEMYSPVVGESERSVQIY